VPAHFKTRSPGMSPEAVRRVLDGTTLAEPLGRLIEAGRVVIEPTADSAANAFVTDADGVIHLVAPNLTPNLVTASLLHEAFHSGVRPLIGGPAWTNLLKRLDGLYHQAERSGGRARQFFDAARDRMAYAQEVSGPYSAELTPEEFGAYAISEVEAAPRAFADWARDAIGAVKAYWLRRFGRQIGAVTPEQLRALAMAAVREGRAGSMPRASTVESQPDPLAPSPRHLKAWQTHAERILAGTATADVTVLQDSPVLSAVGVGKRVTLRAAIARAIRGKHPDVTGGVWRDLPSLLGDPLFVFPRAEGNPNVVLVARSSGGSPIIVGIREDEIRTITPLDTSGGRTPGERLADRLNEALVKPGVVYARSRAALDRVISLTGANSRAGRPYGTALPGQGRKAKVVTREDVVKKLAPGQMSGRRESIAAPAKTARADREAIPHEPNALLEWMKGAAADQQQRILALVPGNFLADWAAPNQTAVKAYVDTRRRMDTYRNRKANAADEIVQRWRKVAGRGGKNAGRLADLMHESTLAGIDPSRTDDETAAKPGYAELRKRWSALSPNAQALFAEVRDHYVAQSREIDQLLMENVKKALEQQIVDANRRYDREIEAAREDGLRDAEFDKVLKDADARHRAAVQKLKFGNKARLAALRQSFEANRGPEPYFPLARFGQYFVSAKDPAGKLISFTRAETTAERQRIERQLREAYPHAKVTAGILSNSTEVRGAMDGSRILGDVSTILQNAGVGDEVMDAIWQRYLQTMPDLSLRKRFIHRKGVAGFSRDAMRAFASNAFHGAHQMGRLKYGVDLARHVEDADEQAKAAPDPVFAGKVANELRLRHQFVMNPRSSSVATGLNQLGFLWYLAATPAAAAVNLSQTWMMGVPVLGSRFGMARATAALVRASKDFVAGKGSVERSDLTDEEKGAIQDLYDRGALDLSRAHDLAGVSEGGAAYHPTRQRAMQVVSWAFHHAERLNREVTALAAYRLARQGGGTHEAAVDRAGDLTWMTHFDYSAASRPRPMQNDAARVMLQFRNFQINVYYRIIRDLNQALKGETPQVRKEAAAQLAGVLGMMAVMAGTGGVPFLKLGFWLYDLFFHDDDDPMDSEERFKRGVVQTLGPQLGGMVLGGVPGYLTGTSLSNRIGMPDLWFQSDDRVQDAKQWWQEIGNQALGPVWGIGSNAMQGFKVIHDGKGVARGVEYMLPKALKDQLRAYRIANEGAMNLRGDPILPKDAVSAADVLKQSLGFTPAKLAEQYERNSLKINMEKRIADQRKGLLDDYARAKKAGDAEAVAEVNGRIHAFNAVPIHAGRHITADTKRESLQTRRRLSRKAENGIVIQNKRLNRNLNAEMPPRVY
jgi:hypothetical protein